jgi:hypothetical protein
MVPGCVKTACRNNNEQSRCSAERPFESFVLLPTPQRSEISRRRPAVAFLHRLGSIPESSSLPQMILDTAASACGNAQQLVQECAWFRIASLYPLRVPRFSRFDVGLHATDTRLPQRYRVVCPSNCLQRHGWYRPRRDGLAAFDRPIPARWCRSHGRIAIAYVHFSPRHEPIQP